MRISVAAPATVSGERFVQITATGKLGRPDERNDPRARRPAIANLNVTGRGVPEGAMTDA